MYLKIVITSIGLLLTASRMCAQTPDQLPGTGNIAINLADERLLPLNDSIPLSSKKNILIRIAEEDSSRFAKSNMDDDQLWVLNGVLMAPDDILKRPSIIRQAQFESIFYLTPKDQMNIICCKPLRGVVLLTTAQKKRTRIFRPQKHHRY